MAINEFELNCINIGDYHRYESDRFYNLSGLVVLLVTHFENKKLQSVGLDGTPPIYPTPEESPQLTHRLLTIPVNAGILDQC